MKSIAFISDHASPLAMLGGIDSGGQNVYVDQVSSELGKMGIRVDIFTRWENPDLPEVVRWKKNIRVIHVRAGRKKKIAKEKLLPYMDEFFQNMMAFMMKHDTSYDLIHAHFFMSASIAQKIKEVMGVPFVVTYHALGKVRTYHQGKADTFPLERLTIEAATMQAAAAIIAECPQDKEDLINFYHAPNNKIVIIPCGVNLQEFFPVNKIVAATVVGLDPEQNYILQLGRMVQRKGIETVLEGFALYLQTETAQRKGKTTLLIVGGESEDPDPTLTPEIGRLQAVVKKLKIENQVEFVGSRPRDFLKYYYSVADIFLTTPWYEPFGITPLEAMACGVPVIGSKVGGIKSTVIHNKTGILIPVKNSRAVADALERLYSEPETIAHMKQRALERVTNEFTWNKVTTELVKVYQAARETKSVTQTQVFFKHSDYEAAKSLSKTKKTFTQSVFLLKEGGKI